MRSLLLIASVLILVRTVQSMISNLLLVEGRTIVLNLIEIAVKVLTIAAVCLLLWNWQRTARAYVVGLALVEVGVLVLTLPYVLKRRLLALGEFDFHFWREALAFAFPLIWVELGAIVLDSGDRFLVQHYLGATSLGYYAAAYGLAQYLWDLLTTPLGTVFFPICMETWVKKGKEETQQLLSNSLRFFLAPAIWVLCAVFLGSRDAIIILASRKFLSAHTLLPVLAVGMVAAALPVFFRPGLLIAKKSGTVAWVSIVAIIANLALNVVLLPRIGVMGAAIATLLSYALQAALTAWLSLRLLPFSVPYGAAVKYLVCACAIVLSGLQIRLSNPWLELVARMGVVLLYPVLLWMFDERLRTAAGNLWRTKSAKSALSVS